MLRLVIITAILVTVASAAIGSTLSSGQDHSSRDLERMRIADAYSTGGANYSILSGVTVKQKTNEGCVTDVTHDTDASRPARPVGKKGDRLPLLGCELAMVR